MINLVCPGAKLDTGFAVFLWKMVGWYHGLSPPPGCGAFPQSSPSHPSLGDFEALSVLGKSLFQFKQHEEKTK